MKRTQGFYWVNHGGCWVVANWEDWYTGFEDGWRQEEGIFGCWYLASNELSFHDVDFDGIDECQIIRQD